MMSDVCGSRLFMSLPDDVFILLTDSVSPRDLCSISLCCTSLNTLVSSDKVWLSQCESLRIVNSQADLVEWRNGVTSYKCLCKFMFSVQPLLGIWVHQNPELGNVVYVMPGFLSVVGCRILPQELGPFGLLDGSLLWAPVFEIICGGNGELVFLLHGQDRDGEYFYPGSVEPVDRSCNVLLLEVEPRMQSNCCKLLRSKSLGHPHLDWESMRWTHRSDGGRFSRSERVFGWNSSVVAFDRLTFEDRQKLLELAMSQVGLKVPALASGPLFPRCGDGLKKDLMLLSERRLLLIKSYQKGSGEYTDWQTMSGKPSNTTRVVARKPKKSLEPSSSSGALLNGNDTKRRSVAICLKESLTPVLRKFIPTGGLVISKRGPLSSESKHASQLHEFIWSGDTIGLSLHASTLEPTTWRAWPKMHDDKYALYKLPMWNPKSGQEYAGLWGGTFGWPPGRPSEDKGKALFFLFLSYEESEGGQLLTATKILEGNHYVDHPNGSAMFIVNVGQLSTDPFPLETDGDFATLDIKHTYTGKGIADGYGFRYPGSKPGSLFAIQDDLLAFVWKESRTVLTLQRIDLQELLRKGKRVPALPPIENFTYLMRSYSNVYTSFSDSTYAL
ncbi:hypothetical protein MKW98_009255 [Papaver atlanticum]|uniref:F-box domain-containing protein n=1 Tax=Papaver atlanticum TaxID=357466 RepID=A0AAD4T0G0_9MAGN|nr:hypothetical protein MKW98_009255 [Papaver atlanticum]